MMKHILVTLFVILASSIFAQQTDSELLTNIIERYEKFNKSDDEIWPMNQVAHLEQESKILDSLSVQLSNLNIEELSTSDIINKEMLELIINDRRFHLQFQSYTFPLNAEGGFLTEVIYSIQSTRISHDHDLDDYLEKLQLLPTYFDQRIRQMRHGQAMGKSSPKLIVRNCISLIDLFLETESNQTFFSQVTSNDTYSASINKVVIDEVIPAYQKLKGFLEDDYLPNAPAAIGISSIKDGKSFYEQRVQYYTTFDISPQEVYDIGIAEVARIRSEMEAIISELEFEGSFSDFFEFLRTDPQFYCTTPQDLLDRAAWITTKAQGQLPKYFGLLPRMPLDVVPVPTAIAPTYTSGRYSPGSYAYQKPGQYWVNTYNLASRPLYVLPSLTLHEGVPGHHLQGMLAAEIENMPNFRKYTYLSAFGEGWGLYSEHLGQEMEIYTTLYEQFGRLTYEMWRACRLVVDPGMHYMGWSRQEAFDFMASNTALSLHEVNTEIDRYIGWPGQAVSYKMGELKIKELRHKAETKLGDSFNIRDFHDVLLMNGSVPLKTLERIIDQWIEGV